MITISRLPEYTQGETGNFTTEATAVETTLNCRAEPAGSNPVIKGVNGDDVVYSWIVYLQPMLASFEFGDPVVIKFNGNEFRGTLKRQSNGQFNTRLWV